MPKTKDPSSYLPTVTPEKINSIQKKTGKRLTERQKRLLLALPHAKNHTEAGKIAGYTGKYIDRTVSYALNQTSLKTYMENLGLIGLNTLEEVAVSGRNEIARVNAATKLVEQAYGKPTEQKHEVGNILIQINKI